MSDQHSQVDDDERVALLQPDRSSSIEVEGVWFELRLLIQQSLPLMLTYLFQYTPGILTTFLAGHLSPDDLAAASIGGTTMVITGLALIEGMATALDTLCSQTYGSGDLPGVGLHIQRMVLFMTALCFPIGIFWITSPVLLSLIIKQPNLAQKAGSFLHTSLIGLPAHAFFEAIKRFLQVQGDFQSGMVILTICTPLNALLSWYFSLYLDMGLNGIALGSSLSQVLRAVLLLLHILINAPWSHKCWGGFSRHAIHNWEPMVKMSFAGAAAILSEYAAFEILTFSTSYLSTRHLAAQAILTTISITAWNIPFAMSVVISTRIGHLIGGGLVRAARRAAVIHALACVAAGCICGMVTFFLRHHTPHMFTDDEKVLEICLQTIAGVSFLQIAEAALCGTNGLLRGLGSQSFAACSVILVNYLIIVPLSIWLELGSPHWGLGGFWFCLPTGMLMIACTQSLYMRMIKWEDRVIIICSIN